MTFRDVQKVAPHSLCQSIALISPRPLPAAHRNTWNACESKICRGSGRRTFDFLAANVAKVDAMSEDNPMRFRTASNGYVSRSGIACGYSYAELDRIC